jgi:RecJ-like exonuclease
MNIRQYILAMVNDPKYYESVSWSKLDSVHTVSHEVLTKMGWSDQRIEAADELMKRGYTIDTLLMIANVVDKENYYLKYAGYKIDHTFRIRNKNMHKEIVRYRFFLDTTLTVTKAVEREVKAFDARGDKH